VPVPVDLGSGTRVAVGSGAGCSMRAAVNLCVEVLIIIVFCNRLC
jgi:hypothetical protein